MNNTATEQQRLADTYLADRAVEINDFFIAFDNVNSDPSWLAEREQEIGVTPDEWDAYRAEKAARTFDVSEVF
jgi:hypothetical protein